MQLKKDTLKSLYAFILKKCYERMVCDCTLDPCFMPEGLRACGKGVLVQAQSPHRGLYIWQAIAWQATLDFGAIDSASGISAPHPCAQIGPDPQGMSLKVLLC